MSAISHVKSNTIGDFTGTVTVYNSQGSTVTQAATDLVRPGDWNSAHNFYQTISGNTYGTSTASGTNYVLGATGNLAISHNTAAGAATGWISDIPASSYQVWRVPIGGANTGVTNSLALGGASASTHMTVWPFPVEEAVNAGFLQLFFSQSFVTLSNSSGRQTGGISVALYSRETNSNSTQLQSFAGTALTWAVTGNNSSYTIERATSTYSNGFSAAQHNSAGSNITSYYTGYKGFNFPLNQSRLEPGQYWLGVIRTASTSSINVGLSHSIFGWNLGTTFQNFGAGMSGRSADATTGYDRNDVPAFPWGVGSYSTAGSFNSCPQYIALNSFTQGGVSCMPAMVIWNKP